MSQAAGQSDRPSVARLGAAAALLTAVLTLVAFGMAFGTPPRSGPSCVFDMCVDAPYTEIAPYFPRDYLWMFPATLVPFAFLVLLTCVHYSAPESKRPLTLAAVAVASLGAGMIAVDYFIQLTVIQPSVLRGEMDGLSLWSQYNPHGIFIALEALGYLLLTMSLALVSSVFSGGGLERVLRWLFAVAGLLALLALAGYYAAYGHDVEYRFEIAIISIAWTSLIVGGLLLAWLFRRQDADVRPTTA